MRSNKGFALGGDADDGRQKSALVLALLCTVVDTTLNTTAAERCNAVHGILTSVGFTMTPSFQMANVQPPTVKMMSSKNGEQRTVFTRPSWRM